MALRVDRARDEFALGQFRDLLRESGHDLIHTHLPLLRYLVPRMSCSTRAPPDTTAPAPQRWAPATRGSGPKTMGRRDRHLGEIPS
jgi:hypothetical protein